MRVLAVMGRWPWGKMNKEQKKFLVPLMTVIVAVITPTCKTRVFQAKVEGSDRRPRL